MSLVWALALAIFAVSTPFLNADQTAQSLEKSVTKKIDLRYWLYLPDGYETGAKDKKWPLVIFLHGAGERGDDLALVKKHGPPKLVAAGKSFPFILASPQCPADTYWDTDALEALLDRLLDDLHVDPERVYLTGLSMGGYGTWELATERPEAFAAIAPVCGGGSTPRVARRLKDTPIWVFHGAKDSVVPLAESEVLVEALKKKGNQRIKFTIYPEATHDSWTATYDNPKLYEWLLSHTGGKD